MTSQIELQFISVDCQNIDFTSTSFIHKSPDKESRNFMFTSPRNLTEYGPGFRLWPHKAKT